jgi:NDP-sugar pyrophosphorylase family protein
MDDLADDDIVLLGFPDTIWTPEDGYESLVRALDDGGDVALGLFHIRAVDLPRSDVVVVADDGKVLRIDVKPDEPSSEWIWGCAAAGVTAMSGLDDTEWPGGYFDLLCREGRDVRGIPLSDVWLDIGTRESLVEADARWGSG